MRPRKILHVIAHMHPRTGGVCQAIRTMSAGLAEENVHSEVVSLDAPDEPFLRTDSVQTHALGPAKGPWLYGAKLTPWLVENMCRFDVVMLHGLWLYPGYALRRAMQICKHKRDGAALPKFFIMPHGMLDPYFQQASERKLKALRNWAYWQMIERKVVAEADGLLFTCEEERELAREPFQPYRPKAEAVVGLGVDKPPVYTAGMRQAFQEKCPELGDSPYILFLGRVHEKKGVDMLIKAYQRVLQNSLTTGLESHFGESVNWDSDAPESIPKLVIAGPGMDAPYGQTIRQLAHENSESAASICFPGMLSGDAKWGAFYGCSAFVLPSHQENFGIAVVEALACGKPVLISDKVNIWREIEQAGGGIVAPDSTKGTQQTLENWLSLSVSQKQAMGQQAVKTFRRNFAVASTTRRLLETMLDDES